MAYTNTHLARLKDVKTMGAELKSEIDKTASKRTLTFTFPNQFITSAITLDFQNCVLSYVDNDVYDIIILDANDKFVCGKRR